MDITLNIAINVKSYLSLSPISIVARCKFIPYDLCIFKAHAIFKGICLSLSSNNRCYGHNIWRILIKWSTHVLLKNNFRNLRKLWCVCARWIYKISSIYPREPLTNPTSTHKLHVRMIRTLWHNNTSCSNTSSSISTISHLLPLSTTHLATGQFNDLDIFQLWKLMRSFIANKWTRESNKTFS